MYIMLSGIIVRSKFHCGRNDSFTRTDPSSTSLAWKISEASAVLSGMGYGKNELGRETFSFAENVDIVGVELGSSPKTMMDSWNKFTANWLRRYVYQRVKIGPLKLPTTFFVSVSHDDAFRVLSKDLNFRHFGMDFILVIIPLFFHRLS